MTIQDNYDYANRILAILKEKKAASLSLLKDSIHRLKRDDNGEEKLRACLNDLVSKGTLICLTFQNKGKTAELYKLATSKDFISNTNSNVSNNDVSEGEDENEDVSDSNCNEEQEQSIPEVATPPQQIGKPEYIIDPEFQSLLDTKTPEQYEALKETIRGEGIIRDALVVWDEANILSDGHNRHQIYEELREELGKEFNIEPPKVIRMSFANRDAAMVWILENQLDRRNLKTFRQIEVALKLKGFYAAKAKANQRGGVSLKLGKGINTNEEVAKRADVSHDTVRKVERILEKAGKKEVVEAINALRRGDEGFSIDGVYQKYCAKKKPAKSPPAPTPKSESKPVLNPPKSKKESILKQDNSTPQDIPKVEPFDSDTPSPIAVEESIKPPSLDLKLKVESAVSYIKDHIVSVWQEKDDHTYIVHRIREYLKTVEEGDKNASQEE